MGVSSYSRIDTECLSLGAPARRARRRSTTIPRARSRRHGRDGSHARALFAPASQRLIGNAADSSKDSQNRCAHPGRKRMKRNFFLRSATGGAWLRRADRSELAALLPCSLLNLDPRRIIRIEPIVALAQTFRGELGSDVGPCCIGLGQRFIVEAAGIVGRAVYHARSALQARPLVGLQARGCQKQ